MINKISIVIPSYQQGKFLEETLLSVLNQDYPSLEIFVIDGGSRDETLSIIHKYEDRLTGWVSERDGGQSDAINKGLRMCTGDIVTWLCSDDVYTPGALQKVNDEFNSLPPDVGLIHGNSEIFLGDQIINYDKGYGNWTPERQLAGMTFPQPSAFFRRSVLLSAGLLDETLHYGMDYELFARMRMITSFHYTDFFFSRYRLHEESKSTTSISKFIDDWIVVFNSIAQGLGLHDLTKILEDKGLTREVNKRTYNFFKEHQPPFTVDTGKMLFYFLVNVIRYDYATEQFERVRKLGAYMKIHFGDMLRNEPSVLKIIRRSLCVSPALLRLARKFKRTMHHQ